MKLRSDFVTNSSSTSFIIISKGKFTKTHFFALAGIQKDSPLTPVFEKLFLLFEEKMEPLNDPKEYISNPDLRLLIKDSLEEGKSVYCGRLSSEDDLLEAYFCTDSFEMKNDTLYINCVNCAW
ncbi:hypothetical protein [Methanoregula sp.]|uniref:hypothetical protein n=1 Tax=Methanoregula sp. TaxID=2052170 RepID=UPI00356A70E4